ncbi:MAG: protein kinase, partial [Gemmatimonadaceae bacterium]|nr:protein kinase [Gemmatimonadaceae bacterium]
MSDLFAQLQASLGDEYALERELPANGPSRLFIARERIFNRAILIKVLSPEHTVDLAFDRFASDVEAVAAIDHPGIVPPLMLGVAAGLPYIITPYVPGVTLRERLVEQPPLTLEEIVGILRSVAESLQVAHAGQQLHLDVNPGTILLSQRAALLTDLGTVRALNAARPTGSTFVGDPSYLAPEQLTGDATPDQRADLYAWGCIAYEMLTGMAPAPRTVREGRVVEAPYEEPAPITLVRRDVPATLIRLITRTLSRDPADRPASADNIAQVLQTIDVSERAQAERALTPAYVPAIASPVATTVKETRVVATIEQKLKLSRRTLAGIAAGLFVVVAAAVGAVMYTPPPPEEPPLPMPAAAAVARSTVVLPFAVVSTDSAEIQLGAGLAIELTQRLAHHGITVMGSASAASLTAERLAPRAVARRLGVASILAGSMQRSGDTIHLDLALLSPSNGARLWGATFHRPVVELYSIEDSITRAIAGIIEGRPEPAASAVTARETSQPGAHLLVLQANGFASGGSVELLIEAIDRYKAAITRDSAYARAHASLALSTALVSALELSASPARLASITAEASRAIALDSSLADAWTALAYVRAIQGANREAEHLFRKALDRDSSVATSWGWYGVLAAHVGDYATAHARILRARTLEPSSPSARAWDAMVFFGEQKFERAEQATRAIPRMDASTSIAMLTHVESLVGVQRDSAAVAALTPRVDAL